MFYSPKLPFQFPTLVVMSSPITDCLQMLGRTERASYLHSYANMDIHIPQKVGLRNNTHLLSNEAITFYLLIP